MQTVDPRLEIFAVTSQEWNNGSLPKEGTVPRGLRLDKQQECWDIFSAELLANQPSRNLTSQKVWIMIKEFGHAQTPKGHRPNSIFLAVALKRLPKGPFRRIFNKKSLFGRHGHAPVETGLKKRFHALKVSDGADGSRTRAPPAVRPMPRTARRGLVCRSWYGKRQTRPATRAQPFAYIITGSVSCRSTASL